jgi:hypothetical protein
MQLSAEFAGGVFECDPQTSKQNSLVLASFLLVWMAEGVRFSLQSLSVNTGVCPHFPHSRKRYYNTGILMLNFLF